MKFSIRDFVFATAAVVVPTTRASFTDVVSGWNVGNLATTIGTLGATGCLRHMFSRSPSKSVAGAESPVSVPVSTTAITALTSIPAFRSTNEAATVTDDALLRSNNVKVKFTPVTNADSIEFDIRNCGVASLPGSVSNIKMSVYDDILKVEAFGKFVNISVDDIFEGDVTITESQINDTTLHPDNVGKRFRIFYGGDVPGPDDEIRKPDIIVDITVIDIVFKSKDIDNDYALYSLWNTEQVLTYQQEYKMCYSVMSKSDDEVPKIEHRLFFAANTGNRPHSMSVGSSNVVIKISDSCNWRATHLEMEFFRDAKNFSVDLGRQYPLDFLSLVEGSDGKVHVFAKTPGHKKVRHGEL